jgi:hypothetical protein
MIFLPATPTRNHGLNSSFPLLEGNYGLLEKTYEQGMYERHGDEEDERDKHTDFVP